MQRIERHGSLASDKSPLTGCSKCSYSVLVMPEPYWPKRKNSYTLSDAEKFIGYARIWCRRCKHTRYFSLKDLRIAFGDIECDDVLLQHRWKCQQCNTSDTIDFYVENPPSGQGVMIRRLVRVEYVRRPIWKDEPV